MTPEQAFKLGVEFGLASGQLEAYTRAIFITSSALNPADPTDKHEEAMSKLTYEQDVAAKRKRSIERRIKKLNGSDS